MLLSKGKFRIRRNGERMNMFGRVTFVYLSVLLAGLSDGVKGADPFVPTPDQRAALDRISAYSLRGHLSFIASDLLQGRDTPSAGLDVAAEYIAAQFRRVGLEPAGDDGYFQNAPWFARYANESGFRMTLDTSSGSVAIPASQISL